MHDVVTHDVWENVGSPEHINERFCDICEKQQDSPLEFFANHPKWRERSRSRASHEPESVVLEKAKSDSPKHLENP